MIIKQIQWGRIREAMEVLIAKSSDGPYLIETESGIHFNVSETTNREDLYAYITTFFKDEDYKHLFEVTNITD